MVCLLPSPLPPFSHIKAQLFTLDVSKAGPCYPLLTDPFPEGPHYPSVHQPMQGGVHRGPGLAPSTPRGACVGHPICQGDIHRSIGLQGIAVAVEKRLFLTLLQAASSLGVMAAG